MTRDGAEIWPIFAAAALASGKTAKQASKEADNAVGAYLERFDDDDEDDEDGGPS